MKTRQREECLQHLIRSEKERKMQKRLKRATGGIEKYPGTTVLVPEDYEEIEEMWRDLKIVRKNPEGMKWKRETDAGKVEELLLNWCVQHFSQTNDTPLSSKGWRKWLDPRSEKNRIEDILGGETFLDPEEKNAIQEIIEAAQRPEGWMKSKAGLDFYHFTEFCRKQEEKKTSSPSGRHYVHTKACVGDEEILRVIFNITNLAYFNNKLLPRWQKVNAIL